MADLTSAERRVARAPLNDVFDGDFGDQDGQHGLGGMRVLVSDDRGLAVDGPVIQRRARYQGRWLRVGHVEAVGVRRDVRRKGPGGRVTAELERIVDHARDLGTLSASDDGALYTACRRQPWSARSCALGPDGVVHLPDDEDCAFVHPAAAGPLGPARELVFGWRAGDLLRPRPSGVCAAHRGVTRWAVSDSRKSE